MMYFCTGGRGIWKEREKGQKESFETNRNKAPVAPNWLPIDKHHNEWGFYLSNVGTLGLLKVHSGCTLSFQRAKRAFCSCGFVGFFFPPCWYNMVVLLNRHPPPNWSCVIHRALKPLQQPITDLVPVQEANPSHFLKGLIQLKMDH